jgi:hypothetical protein
MKPPEEKLKGVCLSRIVVFFMLSSNVIIWCFHQMFSSDVTICKLSSDGFQLVLFVLIWCFFIRCCYSIFLSIVFILCWHLLYVVIRCCHLMLLSDFVIWRCLMMLSSDGNRYGHSKLSYNVSIWWWHLETLHCNIAIWFVIGCTHLQYNTLTI